MLLIVVEEKKCYWGCLHYAQASKHDSQ